MLKSNGHRISEDMTLVAQLLTNPEFQKVLAVHNKVQETWCLNRPPTPVTDNAQALLAEVCVNILMYEAFSFISIIFPVFPKKYLILAMYLVFKS